jgi:predicted GNAT family acetyltransferase
VKLAAACADEGEDPAGYWVFVERRTRTNRALTEAGHGAWFGAFLEGRLVSQLGLLAASVGLARFQLVETHPDVRGRGLAGSLVHHASAYGFETLDARTLVMVADPDYVAIRIYRSVGFAATESQTQCERVARWS